MLNISSLTDRRSSEPKVIGRESKERPEKTELKGKKVPSPLEKTMSYLNTDDEISDSESLARSVIFRQLFRIRCQKQVPYIPLIFYLLWQ